MQSVGTNRNKLKRARELQGWSQADVADKLGCDARSVGRWERGVVSPSPYYRQKLCLLFEQNMEELGFLEESLREVRKLEPLKQEPLHTHSEPYGEEQEPDYDTQEAPLPQQQYLQAQTEQIGEEEEQLNAPQRLWPLLSLSRMETHPKSPKMDYKLQIVAVLHHTSVRISIALFLLSALILGSIITFASLHSMNIIKHVPVTSTSRTSTSVTNIPYGKLLYTTTTPGNKCDHSSGQWADYNQPAIQCSPTSSTISNSSSTSPDLRGTILTSIPGDTYPDNYVLEVQIQQPSTSAADFGLYFRNQPGDQQGIYTFFIHPNGSWGAYVYDNLTAAQTMIASGTTSVDPHSRLYLTVVAIGPDFTFYVNRQKVGSVHDTTYGTGTIGIAVDAGGTIAVSKVGLYRVA